MIRLRTGTMDFVINGHWTVLIINYCVSIQLCVIQVCIDENKNFTYIIIKLLWLFNIQFIIFSNICTYSCTCAFDNLYYIRGKLSPLCIALFKKVRQCLNTHIIMFPSDLFIGWGVHRLCSVYPPTIKERSAPLIKVRLTCNLLIYCMYFVCRIACIVVYYVASIRKVIYFMNPIYLIIHKSKCTTQLNYMIQYNGFWNVATSIIYMCFLEKLYVHQVNQCSNCKIYLNYKSNNKNRILIINYRYTKVEERLIIVCIVLLTFTGNRQRVLSEQFANNVAILHVCYGSKLVLCRIILMSLFLYTILILSSRKVRHLLVVYNDLKVNNITLSALEYSLTLLWYKSIYIYSYKSIFTCIRLYALDPNINICDNISDCTYLKSEVCMSILIIVYTLLQLHVNLYVTLIFSMFNKFIIMISNKITIIKSCMNISDDIASHNMHKCYVNYVIKYICTCYFCYRFSLMIILSMLTGTVT